MKISWEKDKRLIADSTVAPLPDKRRYGKGSDTFSISRYSVSKEVDEEHHQKTHSQADNVSSKICHLLSKGYYRVVVRLERFINSPHKTDDA